MINPSSVRSGHSGFVQTSSENLSGWRLQCLWATYSSVWSPSGLRSFLMMTQNFPCCSFGGRTSFAPPLSNQPPGCASSTSAFSCSGKKKTLSALSAAIQPLHHLFFPSCSSLPSSLLYCKHQSWAQPWAPLILCSQSRGSSAMGQKPKTQEKPRFSHSIIPDCRRS